jgi:uncharacterized protein (UPF0335 family)
MMQQLLNKILPLQKDEIINKIEKYEEKTKTIAKEIGGNNDENS